MGSAVGSGSQKFFGAGLGMEKAFLISRIDVIPREGVDRVVRPLWRTDETPENRDAGEGAGRCRKVQKRVLGGEGLTRVGGDGFWSSLDAKLRFRELIMHGREASNQKFQNESFRAEPRLRRPPRPAGWF